MRLSLTAKLVAALFGMSAVMVALVVVWAGWALSDRFAAYVGAATLAGMDRTVATLEKAYQAKGDWSGVAGHPEAWEAALRASQLPRPPPLPDGAFAGAPPEGGPGDWLPRRPDGQPPGFQHDPPPGGAPPGFAHRRPHGALTLLDASGKVVAGGPPGAVVSARRPLLSQGKPIGMLVFGPGRLPGDIEAAFLAEIARDLTFAGAVALVMSALWALLLARYILAPVRLVASGARLLAGGALSTRIATGRGDELGDLVRDFNTLAVSLEAAEQARRLWVADTSHELRTPLAVLRAQIEALQDGVHEAGAQSLGRLHDEVLRMTRLVDDLHELARADSHALGLRLEAVRPSEIMQEVLSRFAPRLEASGLRLDDTALGRSADVAMADPDRLRQVFANLMENAIRYTDPGGMISVSETRTTVTILLKVEDSAPGVPDNKLPRLFERFFRVDHSRSRQTGGSGLGLAICRAIIEAHSGTISAAPSPFGGLAVTVALPMAGGPRP
jgi:two-component system sensor histidine kinase BaeS